MRTHGSQDPASPSVNTRDADIGPARRGRSGDRHLFLRRDSAGTCRSADRAVPSLPSPSRVCRFGFCEIFRSVGQPIVVLSEFRATAFVAACSIDETRAHRIIDLGSEKASDLGDRGFSQLLCGGTRSTPSGCHSGGLPLRRISANHERCATAFELLLSVFLNVSLSRFLCMMPSMVGVAACGMCVVRGLLV
jgi:hypothetical protein